MIENYVDFMMVLLFLCYYVSAKRKEAKLITQGDVSNVKNLIVIIVRIIIVNVIKYILFLLLKKKHENNSDILILTLNLTKLYKEYNLETFKALQYIHAGVSNEKTLSYVKYVLKNPRKEKLVLFYTAITSSKILVDLYHTNMCYEPKACPQLCTFHTAYTKVT